MEAAVSIKAPADGVVNSCGAMALGEIVDIQRTLVPLPEGHHLAPKGPQYGPAYTDMPAKTNLAPITGKIIATPELVADNLWTSYIIEQFPQIDDSGNLVQLPDYALPRTPGVETHGSFKFHVAREIHHIATNEA